MRPITMVVPFPASGPADVLARILSERMRVSLGQTVVVENLAGAAGSIAVGRVARAAPDGYTLILGNLGTHVFNGAIYSLGYDLVNDFEAVALLPSNNQLIIASNATPASSLRELIAGVKSNPDKVTCGTAGPGSPSHIAPVYFQNAIGVRFQLVPYRGTPQVIQDLVAGQVKVSSSLQQVLGGRIKAFAVTAKSRLAAAPEIPSVDEASLPGFYTTFWFGLWAPKGTPVSTRWLMRTCGRVLAILDQKFHRASNRRLKRSLVCRKPKSRSGGPLLKRRILKQSEIAPGRSQHHGLSLRPQDSRHEDSFRKNPIPIAGRQQLFFDEFASQLTDVQNTFVGCYFGCCSRLCWKLKHSCELTFNQLS